MKLLKEDGDFCSISGSCCKISILLSFGECVWGPGCDCVYLELLDRPARGLPRALAGSRSRLWEANCCTPRRYVCLCVHPWSEGRLWEKKAAFQNGVMCVYVSASTGSYQVWWPWYCFKVAGMSEKMNCKFLLLFLDSCPVYLELATYIKRSCTMYVLWLLYVTLVCIWGISYKKKIPTNFALDHGHLSVTALLPCVLIKFEPSITTNNQRCKLGMAHVPASVTYFDTEVCYVGVNHSIWQY